MLAELEDIPEVKSYASHLSLPPFWRVHGDFLLKMVAKDTVTVAHRDDLIVMHGFLNFKHKQNLA